MKDFIVTISNEEAQVLAESLVQIWRQSTSEPQIMKHDVFGNRKKSSDACMPTVSATSYSMFHQTLDQNKLINTSQNNISGILGTSQELRHQRRRNREERLSEIQSRIDQNEYNQFDQRRGSRDSSVMASIKLLQEEYQDFKKPFLAKENMPFRNYETAIQKQSDSFKFNFYDRRPSTGEESSCNFGQLKCMDKQKLKESKTISGANQIEHDPQPKSRFTEKRRSSIDHIDKFKDTMLKQKLRVEQLLDKTQTAALAEPSKTKQDGELSKQTFFPQVQEQLPTEQQSQQSRSPNLISVGNSYIDRYFTENLTIRSGNMDSMSTTTKDFVIDPKYDANGRPRIDRNQFRESLIESGIVKKHILNKSSPKAASKSPQRRRVSPKKTPELDDLRPEHQVLCAYLRNYLIKDLAAEERGGSKSPTNAKQPNKQAFYMTERKPNEIQSRQLLGISKLSQTYNSVQRSPISRKPEHTVIQEESTIYGHPSYLESPNQLQKLSPLKAATPIRNEGSKQTGLDQQFPSQFSTMQTSSHLKHAPYDTITSSITKTVHTITTAQKAKMENKNPKLQAKNRMRYEMMKAKQQVQAKSVTKTAQPVIKSEPKKKVVGTQKQSSLQQSRRGSVKQVDNNNTKSKVYHTEPASTTTASRLTQKRMSTDNDDLPDFHEDDIAVVNNNKTLEEQQYRSDKVTLRQRARNSSALGSSTNHVLNFESSFDIIATNGNHQGHHHHYEEFQHHDAKAYQTEKVTPTQRQETVLSKYNQFVQGSHTKTPSGAQFGEISGINYTSSGRLFEKTNDKSLLENLLAMKRAGGHSYASPFEQTAKIDKPTNKKQQDNINNRQQQRKHQATKSLIIQA